MSLKVNPQYNVQKTPTTINLEFSLDNEKKEV